VNRLVLLGGGHAHVQVLAAFGASAATGTTLVLINRTRLTPYSGMLPGLIAGHYSQAASHIDLAWLCARHGHRFVEDEAVALDTGGRCVIGASGQTYPYDLLSLDTGSTPPLDVPGARAHAIAVKPIDAFIAAIERLLPAFAGAARHGIAIVGAGPGGFEVALALDYRLRRSLPPAAGPSMHLVGESPEILPELPARARRHALCILREQDIQVHTSARAVAVDAAGLTLASGGRIDAPHVIFVTGAAPDPLFARAGLHTDAHGFVVVDAALRSVSHANVFACGDVAAVADHPRPKAGVFAVRQGPVLARNLRLALAGKPPLPVVPQQRSLLLLSAGRKYAIAARGRWVVAGRWVWHWKDWIDGRFVRRFQPRPVPA